jgi:mRNA interferase MazF
MAKSDIVLITFPFTDLSGSKLRPAVVLVDTSADITVCFITTQLGWQEPTDVLLQPNTINGLRTTSLIRTSKIATLDKSLAKGLLGRLSSKESMELNVKLKPCCNYPDKKNGRQHWFLCKVIAVCSDKVRLTFNGFPNILLLPFLLGFLSYQLYTMCLFAPGRQSQEECL